MSKTTTTTSGQTVKLSKAGSTKKYALVTFENGEQALIEWAYITGGRPWK